MEKREVFLLSVSVLTVFLIIYSISFTSAAWINMSDGFSTSAAGATKLIGVASNGTDFWLINYTTVNFNSAIYHLKGAGVNQNDGFSMGPFLKRGPAINRSDLWAVDLTNLFVNHFNRAGVNQTDGFSVSAVAPAAISPAGITTNVTSGTPTDFWVTNSIALSGFVIHFNRTGGNFTDVNNGGAVSSINALGQPGFSITNAGVSSPFGVVTNTSDFWVMDANDYFVYHFNSTGGNYTASGPIDSVNAIGEPGFSTKIASPGLNSPVGLATNVTFGPITDLWINVEQGTFGYHLFNDIINPSINITSPTQNNTNTINTNLNVNYTVSDNVAIGSVWYSNDSYTVNKSLGSGGVYTNITNITWGQGKHNITIYSNDSVNNLNFSTISFTVDTPNVNITFPTSNNSFSNNANLTVNYTISDSITSISSTWYSNDSYTVNKSLGSSPTFFNITNITWSEGNHNVTVYANNTPNLLSSSTISFTIDTIAPVPVLSCSSSSVTVGATITCNCSATDASPSSGVQVISYTANPATNSTGAFTTSCTATDYAGNSAVASFAYTVSSLSSSGSSSTGAVTASLNSSLSLITFTTPNPIASTTLLIPNAAVEKGVNISKLDNNSVIIEIILQVKNQSENVNIKILEYDSKPYKDIINKSEKTYRYIQINTTNLADNLQKTVVTFRVKKT